MIPQDLKAWLEQVDRAAKDLSIAVVSGHTVAPETIREAMLDITRLRRTCSRYVEGKGKEGVR